MAILQVRRLSICWMRECLAVGSEGGTVRGVGESVDDWQCERAPPFTSPCRPKEEALANHEPWVNHTSEQYIVLRQEPLRGCTS